MKNFNYYYQTIVKQDLINKFNYTQIKKIPKIEKIVLSINSKNNELKQILISLVALELITSQKAIPTATKKFKIVLTTQKGSVTGCKIILKKKIKYNFFHRLISEIFPKLKQPNSLQFNKNKNKNAKMITFSSLKTLNFPELEANYHYFTNLSNLNITIITSANNLNELLFLFKSIKIPFNYCKI
uniref:ribosomal protein L5 n=1 Tax=Odontella aurita TaxID=265563 RepID=UPI00202950B2|nr:ribosomal protein L5 [Odontella aurita]QYB22952.1 ribosomal protein L5 [Odontella aurita]